jgi:hypothetical protein
MVALQTCLHKLAGVQVTCLPPVENWVSVMSPNSPQQCKCEAGSYTKSKHNIRLPSPATNPIWSHQSNLFQLTYVDDTCKKCEYIWTTTICTLHSLGTPVNILAHKYDSFSKMCISSPHSHGGWSQSLTQIHQFLGFWRVRLIENHVRTTRSIDSWRM